MNATQSVVYGVMVSFIVFMLSGTDGRLRVQNGIRSTRGLPPKGTQPDDRIVTAQVMVGWAVLFLMLIALADVPATAPLAAGIAWLFLISTLVIFGQSSFNNVSKIIAGSASNG